MTQPQRAQDEAAGNSQRSMPAAHARATDLVSEPTGAWQRIRPMRASDEIVRQFRQALFEGRFRAGDPVGSEQQLALQFGVSRTTVRDALRSLEAAGIVEIRTG